jgi:hypothetical protein
MTGKKRTKKDKTRVVTPANIRKARSVAVVKIRLRDVRKALQCSWADAVKIRHAALEEGA